MGGRLTRGPVADLHHGRGLLAARVDAQEAAAPQLHQRGLVEHLDRQAGSVGDLAGDLADPGRRQVTRGGVRQIPAQRGRLRSRPAEPDTGLGFVGRPVAHDEFDLRQLDRVVDAADMEVVAAENGTLDHRSGHSFEVGATGVRQLEGNPAGVRQGPAEGGRGVPQLGRRDLGRVTDPDGDLDRPLSAGKHEGLADRPVETARLKRGPVDAEFGRDRPVGGDEEGGGLDVSWSQRRADRDLEVSQPGYGGGDVDLGVLDTHGDHHSS